MNVAEQAYLKRDSLIENVLSKFAQFHCLATHHSDVVDQPRSMPDAVCPAVLNGLPNRLFSIALAGVNRDVEILALNEMKSFNVLLGGVPTFFTRKIEADDPALAKID